MQFCVLFFFYCAHLHFNSMSAGSLDSAGRFPTVVPVLGSKKEGNLGAKVSEEAELKSEAPVCVCVCGHAGSLSREAEVRRQGASGWNRDVGKKWDTPPGRRLKYHPVALNTQNSQNCIQAVSNNAHSLSAGDDAQIWPFHTYPQVHVWVPLPKQPPFRIHLFWKITHTWDVFLVWFPWGTGRKASSGKYRRGVRFQWEYL